MHENKHEGSAPVRPSAAAVEGLIGRDMQRYRSREELAERLSNRTREGPALKSAKRWSGRAPGSARHSARATKCQRALRARAGKQTR